MNIRKICSLGVFLFIFTFFSSQLHAGSRQITVKNDITEKMTKYRHILGRYKPSRFAISVNGEKIDLGQEKKVTMSSNKRKEQRGKPRRIRPSKVKKNFSQPKHKNH